MFYAYFSCDDIQNYLVLCQGASWVYKADGLKYRYAITASCLRKLCKYQLIQRSKKQIILLSGTSKNCGGQVDFKGTCPRDKCCKITSNDPIILFIYLWTSVKKFGQADLQATCPTDKWKFFVISSPGYSLCCMHYRSGRCIMRGYVCGRTRVTSKPCETSHLITMVLSSSVQATTDSVNSGTQRQVGHTFIAFVLFSWSPFK